MGRSSNKKRDAGSEFVLVNVVYEDGSQRSNRRVPRAQLSGFDDTADIRQAIEEQDRKIAELSGQPPARIKSIIRAG
jgi:hypothetical protein